MGENKVTKELNEEAEEETEEAGEEEEDRGAAVLHNPFIKVAMAISN